MLTSTSEISGHSAADDDANFHDIYLMIVNYYCTPLVATTIVLSPPQLASLIAPRLLHHFASGCHLKLFTIAILVEPR